MFIFITGGAGYIGSHMAYAALDRSDDVVVLDNLSTGVAASIFAIASPTRMLFA